MDCVPGKTKKMRMLVHGKMQSSSHHDSNTMFVIQQTTNAELNRKIYFTSTRKNSEEYPPNTLHQMICAWDSNVHTRDKTVFFNSELSSINRTLDLKMKGLISPRHEAS